MKYRILALVILIFSFSLITFSSTVFAIDDSDVSNKKYENIENFNTHSCGATKNDKTPLMTDIPESIPRIVHIVYMTILIAVPVVLVVWGSIDIFKGIIAQKEDEIKKGQQIFVKRLIHAVLIFFVMIMIKIFVGFAADSNSNGIINCVECFIEEKCN